MKNSTSPGYDEIYVKMIEAVEPIGMQWLYQLLKEVWIRSRKPQDWYERTNVQIYRKGDRKQCVYYTEVTFIKRSKFTKVTLEIKGKMAQLYAFRRGKATTCLISDA
jgi:hypothetical protein